MLRFAWPSGACCGSGSLGESHEANSGGGIAGLTFANVVTSPSIQIDIYEGAKSFGEIGAGIGIYSRSLQLLHDIGVKEELDKLAINQTADGGRTYNHAFVCGHRVDAFVGMPILYFQADKGYMEKLAVPDRGNVVFSVEIVCLCLHIGRSPQAV
jgi:hypothetical protein